MEKLKFKFKMSRSRGTEAIAIPDNTTPFNQDIPQNTINQAATSSKKLKAARNTKSVQRHSSHEGRSIHKLPSPQQRLDGRTATNSHGLVRLRNFFKRSIPRSKKETKPDCAELKLDTNSDTNKPVHIEAPSPISTEPKVAAYIPQHAASDYSRTALPINSAYDDNQIRRASQSASLKEPLTFHTVHKWNGGVPSSTSDYEKFLETEQQATAHAALNRLSKVPLPTAPLDIPASDYAARRENRMSVLSLAMSKGQQSSLRSSVQESRVPEEQQPPQLGLSGSLLTKVGEYIKPSKPESMHSQKRRTSTVGGLGVGDNPPRRGSAVSFRTPEEP